jgi:hypothetical protein
MNEKIHIAPDLRAILKGSTTSRYPLENASVQSDGTRSQIVATDGHVLAVVDDDETIGVAPAGETLVPLSGMPTTMKDRNCTLISTTGLRDSLPPIDNIIPNEDCIDSTITVNVRRLRALLDAVCDVNNKDQEVTIGIRGPSKPAVLVTDTAIGVIVANGNGKNNDRIRKGAYDARIRLACDLGTAARKLPAPSGYLHH